MATRIKHCAAEATGPRGERIASSSVVERPARRAGRFLHGQIRRIKGIGEIGTIGVSAAIANAVFHATGQRIRSLPITIDKLL